MIKRHCIHSLLLFVMFLVPAGLPISGQPVGFANPHTSKFQKPGPKKPLVTTSKPVANNEKPTPTVAPTTSEKPGDFLTSFEREILLEINLARKDPKQYANFLTEYRKQYNGNRLLLPNRKPLITFEGVKAADEAIDFLQSAIPLPEYNLSPGISLAAKDRLSDMAKTGIQGHRGSDGSLPDDRLARHGSWLKSIGEAISYNVGTAREVVLGLIVDDGTTNRGHRKSIFSSDYKIIGIASGDSLKPFANCVVDFAGGFVEKGQEVPKKTATTQKSTTIR